MGDEDIEGIGSDLHALRNLYGLLQTNLDEKTRLFLKNLLDSAAERVFEAHTETISSHLRDMLKQPPSNFVNVSQESSHTENSRRKKRCRVCRQSSVKQLKSIKETQDPFSKDNNINILDHDHQVMQNLPTTFSFGNGGGTNKGPQLGCFRYRPAINNSERTGKWQKQHSGGRNNRSEFKGISCLSKNATGDVLFEEPRHNNFTCDDQEASDVIEKIESCIMALKQVVSLAKQVGPKQLLPRDGMHLHANNSSVEPTNDVPPPQSRISPILSPAKDESNSNDCRLMSRTMKKKQDQPKTSQPPSLVSSVGSTTGSRLLGRRSLLFNKYNDEEDGSSSSRRRKSSPISHKRYLHRRNNQARLGFPQKKTSVISTESDNGTASSLLCSSSSSWRSERGVSITRTSNSSEEYDSLTTGETPSRYYTSPSTGSSSSSNNILPNTTHARLPFGFTSSSNDLKSDDQDSTTRHRRAYTGGVPAGSITKMSKTGIGFTRKNNKGHLTRPEKQVGRLRKLKDKLAIIFHHHHHHHHHHHKDMEGHREKQLAVEKVRKSGLVHNLSSQVKKKQEGHFRSLAEGLLNHLRHSKKSKVGTRPLGKGKHVAVKKLHWWEMLHHQRGAKLSNFRTQPCVKRKALPKIK